jgi:hypothetical protein
MDFQLTTPVAFLIFNRPNTTLRVFEAIRKVKPQKLLIVADGARFPEEIKKCNEARSVIERVDWDCEVLTNLSEVNLGCKLRVSSGLDWVFSEVEEAIILEDDCLPTQSFFFFCQTLLEYYRYDSRVMHISGNNFQFHNHATDYSYFFSKYGGIWGWASWRRAWRHYDRDMKTWGEFKRTKMMDCVCDDLYEKVYWTKILDHVIQGIPNTWDYQWLYARWTQSHLSIVPAVNLVSNIGFNSSATHTNQQDHLANLYTEDIWEITHPSFVVRNRLADVDIFNHCYNDRLLNKVLQKIKTFFQKFIYQRY